MHFYTNKKSVPKIGNMKVVIDNLVEEYRGTLCFMTEDCESGEYKFVDISITTEQMQSLKEQIEHYLAFTDKYPAQNVKDKD